jgi:cell wall-associated NlpC family hydrolase
VISRAGARVARVIADAALASIGHQYVWGGAPGPLGLNGWDCSSATDWWVAVAAGQAIPGFPPGTYKGQVHGPTTVSWHAWIGIGVVEIPRAAVQAGDIMLFDTHMGVAVSNSDMVSALNPVDGTQRTPIDGLMPGETLDTLRLKSVDPSLTGLGVITLPGAGRIDADARAIARLARDMVRTNTALRTVGTGGWRP